LEESLGHEEPTEEEIRAREEWDREHSLKTFGFEDKATARREYDEAVLKSARLSPAQKKASFLAAEGLSQTEIASKLGKTQQAISKVLRTSMEKIRAARVNLGGQHGNLSQMMHWADTQGLSEWGKKILEETGRLPARCQRCPKILFERPADRVEIARLKTCKRRWCKAGNGGFRDRCRACGGELTKCGRTRALATSGNIHNELREKGCIFPFVLDAR
jgi:DNA-binding CsgD family transcriptional regulator